MDDAGLVLFGAIFLLFAALQWLFRKRPAAVDGSGLRGALDRGFGARPSITVAVLAIIGVLLVIAGI